MAFSQSNEKTDVMGNYVLKIIDCNFASVTAGEVITGLSNVVGSWYQPNVSDDHGINYNNYSDAGSTAKPGSVYIDGVTSDDTGQLFAIGN